MMSKRLECEEVMNKSLKVLQHGKTGDDVMTGILNVRIGDDTRHG